MCYYNKQWYINYTARYYITNNKIPVGGGNKLPFNEIMNWTQAR